jgi:hypothetical protein
MFHTYVASVLSRRYVTYVFQWFSSVFTCFKHVSSVSSVFFFMLQILYPDVSKVGRVLHIGCV